MSDQIKTKTDYSAESAYVYVFSRAVPTNVAGLPNEFVAGYQVVYADQWSDLDKATSRKMRRRILSAIEGTAESCGMAWHKSQRATIDMTDQRTIVTSVIDSLRPVVAQAVRGNRDDQGRDTSAADYDEAMARLADQVTARVSMGSSS